MGRVAGLISEKSCYGIAMPLKLKKQILHSDKWRAEKGTAKYKFVSIFLCPLGQSDAESMTCVSKLLGDHASHPTIILKSVSHSCMIFRGYGGCVRMEYALTWPLESLKTVQEESDFVWVLEAIESPKLL